MNRDTIFSPCRKWRYTLWRSWDCDLLTGCADDLPHAHEFVQFIGLNPSTADEVQDDPTIRRCIGYAKAWGYGAMCMTNLFAYRATDPKEMKIQPDPVGPENDDWLCRIGDEAGIVIAAWGTHGAFDGRGEHVRKLVPAEKLHYLKMTQFWYPGHPLYLKADLKPQLWKP